MRFSFKSIKKLFFGTSLFSSTGSAFDQVEKPENDVKKDKWEELKSIFTDDENGLANPRLVFLQEIALFSYLTGLVIGGLPSGQDAGAKFIAENKMTMYDNIDIARKKYVNAYASAFLKEGLKMGLKVTMMSTSAALIVVLMDIYRGHSSVIDYTLGVSTACGIYKFKQGFKPMVSGVAIGAFGGTLAGGLIIGVGKLAGVTLQDVYNVESEKLKRKQEKEEINVELYRQRDLDPELSYQSVNESKEDNSEAKSIDPEELFYKRVKELKNNDQAETKATEINSEEAKQT